jgi:hypothetical protein
MELLLVCCEPFVPAAIDHFANLGLADAIRGRRSSIGTLNAQIKLWVEDKYIGNSRVGHGGARGVGGDMTDVLVMARGRRSSDFIGCRRTSIVAHVGIGIGSVGCNHIGLLARCAEAVRIDAREA